MIISQPTTITATGPFTVTRPLVTETLTICNEWYVPQISHIASDKQKLIWNSPASTAPVGTGNVPAPQPTNVSPTGPEGPAFTGGASSVVASAGAGLAAVFGAAALLL